jgi:hypothetical protein
VPIGYEALACWGWGHKDAQRLRPPRRASSRADARQRAGWGPADAQRLRPPRRASPRADTAARGVGPRGRSAPAAAARASSRAEARPSGGGAARPQRLRPPRRRVCEPRRARAGGAPRTLSACAAAPSESASRGAAASGGGAPAINKNDDKDFIAVAVAAASQGVCDAGPSSCARSPPVRPARLFGGRVRVHGPSTGSIPQVLRGC